MSIIQNIRDKYARIAVIAIALALVGFILTDYFQGQARTGGDTGGGTTIGVINGTKVKVEDFSRKLEQTRASMKQQGYPENEGLQQAALEQTWNMEVNRIIFSSEFRKIGMRIGDRESGDIKFGPNAHEFFKQRGTDPNTGVFDPALAKQELERIMKSKQTPQSDKDAINNFAYQLEQQRMSEKYLSLLTNSANYPRWYVEKKNADNSLIAKVSLVRKMFGTIPDTTIKVEDKELNDYISKHKKQFEQKESRSVNYVAFDASASKADSATALSKLLELRTEFDTTHNMSSLLLREGGSDNSANYQNSASVSSVAKDSILKLPVGVVYGPYVDNGSHMLAKVLEKKAIADSVKVRHILISTEKRDTAAARSLADSIMNAIANGSNFDSLCVRFSEDGTRDKGGIYDSVGWGRMVPPFNDFMFLNPVGSKGVVKTDFGYHYMEVLKQWGSDVAYKIAYLPSPIYASDATIQAAQEKASVFASESRDAAAFDQNFEKKLKPQNYQKGVSKDIKPNDAAIQGLGFSRALVKNIFKGDLGEVLSPEMVGENYVVAAIIEVVEDETAPLSKVRDQVTAIVRNEKKAQMLKQQVGKVTTLEAAATAWGGVPVEPLDSIRMGSEMGGVNALGFEPRLRGAAFNPGNKGKIIAEVLIGNSGAYVMRVDNVTATPLTAGSVPEQRTAMRMQALQQSSNQNSPFFPANILQKAATIKDKRSSVY